MKAVERDADKAIAETIMKNIRYLAWLDSASAERTMTDEARIVRDRLRGVRKIFLLGVLPAMPSVFHVDVFRRLVESGINSRLRPEEKAWLAKNTGRIAGWNVLDSEELVEFISRRKHGFFMKL